MTFSNVLLNLNVVYTGECTQTSIKNLRRGGNKLLSFFKNFGRETKEIQKSL